MFSGEKKLRILTAAEALVRLSSMDLTGIIHLGGAERLSRFELVRRVGAAMGIAESLIRGNRQQDAPSAEPRPRDVSLDTTRLAGLLPNLRRPSVQEAVLAMGLDTEPGLGVGS